MIFTAAYRVVAEPFFIFFHFYFCSEPNFGSPLRTRVRDSRFSDSEELFYLVLPPSLSP